MTKVEIFAFAFLLLSGVSSLSLAGDVDSEEIYRRGLGKRAKQDFDGALVDFNKAIALDPTTAPAYSAPVP